MHNDNLLRRNLSLRDQMVCHAMLILRETRRRQRSHSAPASSTETAAMASRQRRRGVRRWAPHIAYLYMIVKICYVVIVCTYDTYRRRWTTTTP